jgi:hypothetical protein
MFLVLVYATNWLTLLVKLNASTTRRGLMPKELAVLRSHVRCTLLSNYSDRSVYGDQAIFPFGIRILLLRQQKRLTSVLRTH